MTEVKDPGAARINRPKARAPIQLYTPIFNPRELSLPVLPPMIKKLIRTLDNRLFSSFLPLHDDQLSYCRDIYMEADPDANPEIPAELAEYLKQCNTWQLRQLHYHHKGTCILEPDQGWAVTPKWQTIPWSNYNLYIHKYPTPLYSKYALRKKKTVVLDKVINLKYVWNNYGHFMNDILGQLHLAERLGVTDAHLVVPKAIQQKAYFRDMMQLSARFREKRWFFQEEGQYIESGDAHFLNTWFSHRYNFDATLDLLDEAVLRRHDHNGSDRIFVGRKDNRRVRNLEEVMPVLDRHGFRYVLAEGKSLEEQIALFANASHVIGIHGAALTNIMFRRGKPLKFMELYSDCHLDPFYYWICVHYGFAYAAMICKSLRENRTGNEREDHYALSPLEDLYVNPVELEEKIVRFIGK